MTDHSQLVKRLREWDETPYEGDPIIDALLSDIPAAANAIDALQAECLSSMAEIAAGRERAERAEAARDTLQARVEALEAERKRLTRLATDRSYMMEAYRSMLGPKGLEVAVMWEKQGVTRQHTSWGPEAWKASGEDRAGWLLDIEAAPKTPLELD